MADQVIELGAGRFQIYDSALLADAGRREKILQHELGVVLPRMFAQMGQEAPGIFQTLLGFLGDGLGVLGDVIGFPTGLIATGADFVITTIAELARNIPIVGELIADILQAGNTLLGAGLSLPSETLGILSTLLTSFRKLPEEKQKSLEDKSETKIEALAAQTGQERDVDQALNISNQQQEEKDEKALGQTIATIAAPVVGGIGLGAALLPALGPGGAVAAGVGIAGLGFLVESLFGLL